MLLVVSTVRADAPAAASESDEAITLDNGLLRLVVSRKTGQISSIHALLKGKLTQISDPKAKSALYLDWNGGPETIPPDLKDKQPRAGYGEPKPEKLWIVQNGPDAVEVAIRAGAGQWNPFSVEYHHRLPRGERLFYGWVCYKHDKGMPVGTIGQTRLVFRGVTGTELFTHHIVDEKRCRPFPTSPEVETIQDATTLHSDGTIYTKYDNSAFTSDYVAHGLWGNGVGMWVLWPSTEFCNGGPVRQDLTVHPDNVILAMFQSGHFGAGPIRFGEDETWSKLCGPVAFYVNEAPTPSEAFANATERTNKERSQWPYPWLKDDDYPLDRGSVRGAVKLSNGKPVAGAWAILSPVETIDWSQSANGYQRFVRVEADGSFELTNVRPGKHKLNLSGADQPTDHQQLVDVAPGAPTDLGTVTWQAISHGQTLWQVGTFDRATREFMAGDDPRNYARFLDYFKAFPKDVVYVIGKSNPKHDWFYAQWNWFNESPCWTIRFAGKEQLHGKAILTVGIASRQYASGKLLVKLNGETIAEFHGDKTGAAGYRSGSQDSKYVLETVTFDATKLKSGTNDLAFQHGSSRKIPTDPQELRQLRRPNGSVMYDAIRLEVAP
jgi:rhamnogalacturonan endolyase